jgi:hypothetical protein
MTLELFVSAYATTSLVMFPILVFIVVLLIRDLGKYSKISLKILKKRDLRKTSKNHFYLTYLDL